MHNHAVSARNSNMADPGSNPDADNGENLFAHGGDNNKGNRAYLITAFKDMWDMEQQLEMGDESFTPNYASYWDWDDLVRQVAIIGGGRAKPVHIKYASWQVERCPETQRIHTHMVACFTEPIKFTQLCNKAKQTGCQAFLDCDRINFKGLFNLDGACKYVTKEESRVAGPWEWGEKPAGKGTRTDLLAVAETIKEAGYGSKGIKRAAELHPMEFMKYHGGITRYARLLTDRPPFDVLEEVILCWGAPGSGKTYFAEHYCDSFFTVPAVKNQNVMPYFDSYQNEEVLFVDEMQGGVFNFGEWKKLFNPGSVPSTRELLCRESGVPFGSRVAIFCTNRNPLEWWDLDKCGADIWELIRRFTSIRVYGGEFGSVGNPPYYIPFSGGDKLNTALGSRAAFARNADKCRQSRWDLELCMRHFKSIYNDSKVLID